ncbi:hypothetical protein ACQ4PT_035967 [Festuca glaucescens]
MCSGPRKPSTPHPPATPKDSAVMASLLLELAAADDVAEFRRVVEEDKACLDAEGSWYGPSAVGQGRLATESRTPAMVAALYGSTSVLAYALSVTPREATRASGTDGATALHLAAAGGAANAVAATQLLLAAGASTEALSASGLRAGDLLPRATTAAEKPLRLLLKSPASSPSSSPKKSASPPAAQEPRKEYPPDLTLPDLKSGLFSTDEFRMYSFKVKPCSRAYSHDWTECPFVHPGENARRRDPRRYSYSCVPCPEFRKGGSCRKGDGCEYAHGVFECWLHPAQYRTRLCKDEVGCARRICFFAHRRDELRSVNPSAVSVGMMQPVSPRSSPPNGMDTMGMLNPGAWPSSPASRLKTARELDFDLEMLALDQYQQKLFDKVSNSAHSPRASWGAPNGGLGSPHAAGSPARNMPDYTDLLGSMDTGMLSQLHALSLKQAGDMSAYNSLPDSQLQHMPTSPMVGANNSFGLDHSMAKAIMTSRASAFAKRSQSFIDRGARAPATRSLMSPATMGEPSMLTDWGSPSGNLDWGSPSGKLDWGVQGDELHKFRKSASFGFRGQSAMPVTSPATQAEPDVSWVNSLVKDGHAGDHFSQWLEQEQMVA